MQGYIISIKSVRDEDTIVEILTKNQIYKTYRFYGMRHGSINVGFKIDFELEHNLKSNMARLKDVMHLNFEWIFEREKLFAWQKFIKLLPAHFKDVENIDGGYFELLDETAKKLAKQNEKRVFVETYTKILKLEGRLHDDFICFLCEIPIQENVAISRAFLPAHKNCTFSPTIQKEKLEQLYATNSTIFLDDAEVEILWDVLMQGL